MLPFHAQLFCLRLIMEGPCFIASNDSLHEGLSFVKPIKEFPENFTAVLLVLIREHLRYPATAYLGKFKHFMDYVMSCTCGYGCWAISSTVILLSARIKSFTACCFAGVFTSKGLPCLSSSLILYALLKSLDPFIHISLVRTATPILGRHSSIDFTWFYTFCSKKSYHSSLFFMCCVLQGCSH